MYGKKVSHLVVLSFWMLLLLLLFARGATAATIITIPAEVEVDGPVLLFQDIAHITTDNPAYAQSLGYLRIGKAPSLGQTKRYNRSFFTVRLRQLRLNMAELTLNIPPVVYIHRRSLDVDIQKLAQTAKQAVLRRMDYQGQEVHININSIVGELKLPVGDIDLTAEVPQKKRLLGRQVIPVEVLIDGLPYKKVNVSLNVEVFVMGWVAGRKLQRHHLITRDDLKLKRLRLNDFVGEELINDISLLLGKRTRVPIQKDKPISSYKIEKPPLVERGDLVTIKAFLENISLLTPGQALESGGRGEVIRVKSLSSKKKLMARIVSSELVEVEVR